MAGLTNAPLANELLTGHIRAQIYSSLIGIFAFPLIFTPGESGRLADLGVDELDLDTDTSHAHGAYINGAVSKWGALPYNLTPQRKKAIFPAGWVDIFNANGLAGFDPMGKNVAARAYELAFQLEALHASTLANTSNFSAGNTAVLSGSNMFDAASPTSPWAIIEAGMEAVGTKCGKRPDVAIMDAKVFSALVAHPSVVARLQYTNPLIPQQDTIAALLGLKKIYLGRSIKKSSTGTKTNLWAKGCYLLYTGMDEASVESLNYGMTFRQEGMPYALDPTYSPDNDSWLSVIRDAWQVQVLNKDAGFSIINAIA